MRLRDQYRHTGGKIKSQHNVQTIDLILLLCNTRNKIILFSATFEKQNDSIPYLASKYLNANAGCKSKNSKFATYCKRNQHSEL